jgi:hypothetical protein
MPATLGYEKALWPKKMERTHVSQILVLGFKSLRFLFA